MPRFPLLSSFHFCVCRLKWKTTNESHPSRRSKNNHLIISHAHQEGNLYLKTDPGNTHDQKRVLVQNRFKNACGKPATRIVFIKTHKTASSTVASIFQRFGYLRNLLMALPNNKISGHSFPDAMKFPRKALMSIPKGIPRTHFDIITDHVRYDRQGLEGLIPNAKYVTILRDPVTQLESAFGYFEMAKGMGIVNHSNPFRTFMEDPDYFYRTQNYNMKNRSRNGLLYDLGFEPEYFEDSSAVREMIDRIDREFHIVLLMEYLDESLILMKNILCWDFKDIIYVSKGIRSKTHRYPVSQELQDQIRIWNQADVLLYEHFNRTFWKNVRHYDGDFDADLRKFRTLNRQVMNRCIDNETINTGDRRENKYVIDYRRQGGNMMCRDLLRRSEEYTRLFQRIRRLGNRMGVKAA